MTKDSSIQNGHQASPLIKHMLLYYYYCFCYHSNTATILNDFVRRALQAKTTHKTWGGGKLIYKMFGGEKHDKGTGEEAYCRKGERVSYCQQRRMGNGHMDGWRLISLQWFRGGSGDNFVPPSGYLLLPLDTDNTGWIWNALGEKGTFSISNDYLILASSGQ